MRSILTAALLALFVPAAQVANEDNPFKSAKVGDWVEYKMTGPNMEGKTKMTITAKDDKEVTYEVTTTYSIMGKQMTNPIEKQKIDLTKSYDPIVAANLKGKDVKFENQGEGTEKIKVGGKELDTKWTKMKTTETGNNMTVVTDYKTWFSKDVPVSGLVGMETTNSGFTTKLELIGSGRK